MKKVKVLFVCLGNICRSPLAEAIFKDKVKRKGLSDRIEADSCGTSDFHIGDTPDPRTIRNALENGIVIEHLGRQLSVKDLEYFDIILAMDKSNYRNIFRLPGSQNYAEKVKMMRDFDPLGGEEVPDPYYGNEKGFQEVFEILDRSTEGLIKYLEEEVLAERR